MNESDRKRVVRMIFGEDGLLYASDGEEESRRNQELCTDSSLRGATSSVSIYSPFWKIFDKIKGSLLSPLFIV